MDDVHVVEVSVTGSRGVPKDVVAEVAVCRVFSDGRDYDTVYTGSVSMDPRDLGKESLDFLTSNYGIDPQDLYFGEDEGTVVENLQRAVFGKECTSFDVNQTFGRFLCFEPWDATRNLTLLPSYSVRLPREARCAEPGEDPVSYAYERLCLGDPAGVGGGRRASDRAQMSACLVMGLRRGGFF